MVILEDPVGALTSMPWWAVLLVVASRGAAWFRDWLDALRELRAFRTREKRAR